MSRFYEALLHRHLEPAPQPARGTGVHDEQPALVATLLLGGVYDARSALTPGSA